MATINTINIGGIDKEIEDSVARANSEYSVNKVNYLDADVVGLQTQINQIIAPTGEAPNPSEITDARIGIDDTIYETLGASIRTQVLNCRDESSDIFIESLREIPLTFVNGYLDNSGNVIYNTNWKTSQFINVIGFANFSGTFSSTVGKHICYYDRYGGYLGGLDLGDAVVYSKTIKLDYAVAFIRISTTNDAADTIKLKIPRDDIRDDGGFIRVNPSFSSGYVKSDGTIHPNASWRHTSLIPARKFVKYGGAINSLSSDVGCNIAFYDQNGNFVRGEGLRMDLPVAEHIFPMENDEYYVAFSIPDTVNEGYVSPYVSFVENMAISKIKVVSSSERGTFRSVTAAVKAAIDGDIVYVKRGTYAGEHIEAWGKTISIIGEDKLNTVITCSDSTYANPLIEMSTGLLENLTLKTLGGTDGYTLHDEDTFSFGKKFTIRNCIIENEILRSAIGMGMNGNTRIEISDCELRTNSAGPAFYLHDSNESQYAGSFIVDIYKNIFINSGANILNLQSQSMEGSTVLISFIGNTFYRSDVDSESDILCKVKQSDSTYETSHDFSDLTNWTLSKWSRLNNLSKLNRNTFG